MPTAFKVAQRGGGTGVGCKRSLFLNYFFIITTRITLRPLQPGWKKNTCIIHNHNKTGQAVLTHLTWSAKEIRVSSETFPLPLHNAPQFNHHYKMWFCHRYIYYSDYQLNNTPGASKSHVNFYRHYDNIKYTVSL